MMGSDFAALGVYSVMSCRKTVSASRIVIVSVIFSPESGTNEADSQLK